MKPIHNRYDLVESLHLFEGMTLKILLSASDTNGLQAVFEDIVEPGVGPGRHIHHKQDETFIFLEGISEVNLLCLCGFKIIRDPQEKLLISLEKKNLLIL